MNREVEIMKRNFLMFLKLVYNRYFFLFWVMEVFFSLLVMFDRILFVLLVKFRFLIFCGDTGTIVNVFRFFLIEVYLIYNKILIVDVWILCSIF